MCTRLWATARVLDILVRANQQSFEKLQDGQPCGRRVRNFFLPRVPSHHPAVTNCTSFIFMLCLVPSCLCQCQQITSSFATGDAVVQASVSAMYRATADDRGTVQALARELDDVTADGPS